MKRFFKKTIITFMKIWIDFSPIKESEFATDIADSLSYVYSMLAERQSHLSVTASCATREPDVTDNP